jgi:CheY-like chemotaxis protein/signal transduction histidine kinase
MANVIPFPARPFSPMPSTSSSTVLVVDDDPDIADSLKDHLVVSPCSLQLSVESLEDPRKVPQTVRAKRPDLILLDFEMPYMNGLQVMQNLAELPRKICPPVIFLTAFPEYRRQAMEAGARDFLDKNDLNLDALAERIEYVLGQVNMSSAPFVVKDRITEEIIRAPFVDDMREVSEAVTETSVESLWFLLDDKSLNRFDWETLEADRASGGLPNHMIERLRKDDGSVVWVDRNHGLSDCQDITFRRRIRPAEQSLWLPVSTNRKGHGLWLAFFLPRSLAEGQRDELNALLPQLLDRCSEAVGGFYRVQIERRSAIAHLRQCTSDLTRLRLGLQGRDGRLEGDELVWAQLEASRLIDDIDAYAREAHSRILQPEQVAPIAIGECVVSVLEQIRPWARSKGVEIEAPPLGTGEVWVRAVRHSLEYVIRAPLRNAVEAFLFLDRDDIVERRIGIEGEVREGRYLLRVMDTGGGLSAAARQHLFERGWSSKAPNRGWGLSLSREILEDWEAWIALSPDCRAPWSTVFELTLPLWEGGGDDR